jgi:flagellar hook-associated protein 1 FlgK
VSINSLFEISQRSFRALNAKMDATGQNIANANSEGYSRRRVTLEAGNSVTSGRYTSPVQNRTPGDGPSVASYERARSRILDQSAAEAQAGQSGAKEEAQILSRLEGALATDTDRSLTSSLERFFTGFNDLANNPDGEGAREAVIGKGKALAGEFNRLDQKIGALASDTASALSDSVDEANGLIKEVASLNGTIREAQAGGTPDLAAKDRRDTLVKKLSKLVPVETQENADGEYALSVDGMSVVQGEETTLLKAQDLQKQAKERKQPPNAVATVTFGNTGVALKPGDEDAGTIGAQVRALNQTLPELQGRLDGLAEDVVTKVNGIHSTAYDLNGNTGGNFFDASSTSSTTAGGIQLALSAPADVATFGDDGSGNPRRGDVTPARDIAGLSEELTPESISLAADVGQKVQRAEARKEAKAATADHLESMAQGTSGVSIDEEMSSLIEQQQQFAASARVLRTAREVTSALLSI